MLKNIFGENIKTAESYYSVGSLKPKKIDFFGAFNLGLFTWMCHFVYYQRFIDYRGAGNIDEFFTYALFIIVAIGIGWWYFRRFNFPTSILFLLQLGILIHFMGGLLPIQDGRLYDTIILRIRFDKYVHSFNSFVAALLIHHLFKILKVHLPCIRNFVILMFVLGLGATIEIIEYIVLLTVPDSGVGGYHNNMQDLLANLAGGLFFIFVQKIKNKYL